MIRKVEVERFSLTSSRSFDEVLAAINDAIGHPDMAEFWKSAHQTRSAAGRAEPPIRMTRGCCRSAPSRRGSRDAFPP